MLVGTIGGGVLGTLDLALPYLARSAMLVVLFGIAWLTMHDLGFSPRALRVSQVPKEMRAVAEASLEYGWRRRPVRLVMLASALQWGFMTWGFYAWQPYLLELLGRDAVWISGVAASLIAGAMIVGNAIVDRVSTLCGRRTTLLVWSAAIQCAAAVAVGLAQSFWVALAAMAVLAVAIGVTGPAKQAYLHASVPSAQRATVISFDSMFGNGGGIVGQAGLGWLARVRSIGIGYVVGGALTAAAVPLFLGVRREGGAADALMGGSAGVRAPCAAQGIPEIAGIDARARQAAR